MEKEKIKQLKIEKSVRPPCTCPEVNALDDSQPILIVTLL